MGLLGFVEQYTKDKPALGKIVKEPVQKSRKIMELIGSKQWDAVREISLGGNPLREQSSLKPALNQGVLV